MWQRRFSYGFNCINFQDMAESYGFNCINFQDMAETAVF